LLNDVAQRLARQRQGFGRFTEALVEDPDCLVEDLHSHFDLRARL
jgi:hypothetical protein